MDAYIDYNSFCSYLRSADRVDCDDFLRHRFNFHFAFEENKLLKKQDTKRLFESWATLQTQGRGEHQIVWRDKTIKRPLCEKEFFEQDDTSRLSAVYMLDGDEVDAFAEKGGLLIAPIGKETGTIKRLWIEDDCDPDSKDSIDYSGCDMEDWSKLSKEMLPCTDIIIWDRYFFSFYPDVLKQNVFPLMKAIPKYTNGISLNIVIFTQMVTESGFQVRCETYCNIIRDALSQLTNARPNITIVDLPDNKVHDRGIITNYRYIVSGRNFASYFTSDNDTASSMEIFSIAKPRTEKYTVPAKLAELQENVINNPDINIYGDGVSNLLHFESEWVKMIPPDPIQKGEIIRVQRDEEGHFFYKNAIIDLDDINLDIQYRVKTIYNNQKDTRGRYPKLLIIEPITNTEARQTV